MKARLTYKVEVTLDLGYVDEDGHYAWAHQGDSSINTGTTILKNAINVQKVLEMALNEEYGLDNAVERYVLLTGYERLV